ncbi:Homoaconitase, mitochondrial [Metarhizium anisopliae]|nr:Homoaconitase, mitochondrial [Metarhizium anisopliae]
MARLRAIALRSLAPVAPQGRASIARLRSPSIATPQLRLYTSTVPPRQQRFHSQLESIPDAHILHSFQKAAAPTNPQNLTEKIFQRHSIGLAPEKTVKAGDFISIVTSAAPSTLARPTTNPLIETSPFCNQSHESWPNQIHDGSQIVMGAVFLNHPLITITATDDNKSESNRRKYALIEEFARNMTPFFILPALELDTRGVRRLADGTAGHAWPGTLCVASDSHSPIYGGIGCLEQTMASIPIETVYASATCARNGAH